MKLSLSYIPKDNAIIDNHIPLGALHVIHVERPYINSPRKKYIKHTGPKSSRPKSINAGSSSSSAAVITDVVLPKRFFMPTAINIEPIQDITIAGDRIVKAFTSNALKIG